MLQDNVPGFPFESAKIILEEDLGRPLEELYDSFSPVPLAAASLGQVSRLVTSPSVSLSFCCCVTKVVSLWSVASLGFCCRLSR